ncbi:MAG: hypothetical protein JSR91_17265 [Proteobacteria bacterium]|nr:hypothetical protein [Pseudomonadota bacterium]
MTAAVLWNMERSHYTIVVVPDFAARQVEILLGTERRARRVMEQQLEAANSEVRFASLARTRLRLARDLHDTLAHSIVALLIQIRMIRHFLSTDRERVSEGLAAAEEAAVSGLARVRDAIARLRMPDELDVAPDVEGMLSDFSERTGIEVSVHIGEGASDGLRTHGVTVQRILGETLRNVEAHAKARHVRFHAAESDKRLIVEIGDDGRGFDPTVAKPGHFGLIGMAELAELVGGECSVESSPQEGTLVRVSLPVTLPQAVPSSNTLSDAGAGAGG